MIKVAWHPAIAEFIEITNGADKHVLYIKKALSMAEKLKKEYPEFCQAIVDFAIANGYWKEEADEQDHD